MNWKVVLAILTVNVTMMSASYTMIIPFLPLYLVHELKVDPEVVNLWTGAIFAVCFAVTAVMAPVWGRLSDSRGRKLMVIRSSSLIALAYFLGGMVQTPLQLFFVRILQGFAAGLWPASLSLMSSYAPRNQAGICMGIMQSAHICGGIIGPLFGGVLAENFGMRVSFFMSGSALTLITLITLLFIKEPPRPETAGPGKKVQTTSFGTMLRNPSIRMLLLCSALTNMVLMMLQPIMALYVGELHGTLDDLMIVSGIVFSLSGIAGVIAAPIWGRLGQARGFFKMEVISLFAGGILTAAQFIPNTLIPFAALNFVAGLGMAGILPSANSMVVVNTKTSERGTAFGLLFSAQKIGGTAGPLISGVIATYIHISWVFPLAGSLLILMSIILLLKAPSQLRQQTGSDPENQ